MRFLPTVEIAQEERRKALIGEMNLLGMESGVVAVSVKSLVFLVKGS
jgi:hypothetical protein